MMGVIPARTRQEGGFALLIVLWALVLLTLIFTRLVSAGRTETEVAFNLRAAAQMQTEADGLVYSTIFSLLGPAASQWKADGTIHRVSLSNGSAEIAIVDLGGRVNPNTASAPLLTALLHQVGADVVTADAVGEAISDWRSPDAQGRFEAPQYHDAGLPYIPPGAPFNSLTEVNLVLGMTPALFSRLAPHLSIYNRDNTDPAIADPAVRAALKQVGIDIDAAQTKRPLRDVFITTKIVSKDGKIAIRQANVELQTSSSGLPFKVLTWAD
ncbi:general secretion pathway protein GspK [Acidisoma cellulosilytica]|uniref:General secretion pathway protein GspK n=1 Tax=Acidisoma cellulosilyticum TaxID=2802395 RepID=A0A963Z5Y3_9PROT|nr:type II secretion system protein GspK [Acidisoma cellulosilyticum]MCB8883164.1 general secretion pathway protein GspK [Acidisoma cellulosilyticum]